MKIILRLLRSLLNSFRRTISIESAIGFAEPVPVFDTSATDWNTIPTTVTVTGGSSLQTVFTYPIVYSSVPVFGSSGMSAWSQQQASLGQHQQGAANMQGLMNGAAQGGLMFDNANLRNSLQQQNLR